MSVLDPYIVALLVYAPAFIANWAPIVAKNLPLLRGWATPIWPSVLGANKTWRGLLFGVVASAATGGVLYVASPWEGPFAVFVAEFTLWGFIGFSAWMGFAALAGDMVESAIKRRRGFPPGARWMPWDGIDYVLAALLLGLPFFVPTVWQALFILFIGPGLSSFFNVLSFIMGWKKVPY